MALKSQDFLKLNLLDKINTLYREGKFVVAIRYYRYKVNLYLLHNYYIEAFYNPKTDRIEKVELMDREHTRFNFYVDQIKLPDLPRW